MLGYNIKLDSTYGGGAMMGSTHSRVAQLLYTTEQPFNFKTLVEDLHCTLMPLKDTDVSLDWDGAHLARFDLPSVRIAIAAAEHPCDMWSACLTISVEPSVNGSDLECGDSYALTCSSLVEYLNRQNPAVKTIRHQVTEPLTTSLHDRLIAALPLSLQTPKPDTRLSELQYAPGAEQLATRSLTKSVRRNSRTRAINARARGKAHFTMPSPAIMSVTDAGKSNATLPDTFDRDFARVRETFHHIEPVQQPRSFSTPLRFAAYALLVLAWSPLGLE